MFDWTTVKQEKSGLASAEIPPNKIEKLKLEKDIEELFNNNDYSNHIDEEKII